MCRHHARLSRPFRPSCDSCLSCLHSRVRHSLQQHSSRRRCKKWSALSRYVAAVPQSNTDVAVLTSCLPLCAQLCEGVVCPAFRVDVRWTVDIGVATLSMCARLIDGYKAATVVTPTALSFARNFTGRQVRQVWVCGCGLWLVAGRSQHVCVLETAPNHGVGRLCACVQGSWGGAGSIHQTSGW